LGALVGCGADRRALSELARSLGLEGVSVKFEKVRRAGLSATKAVVEAEEREVERRYPEVLAIVERAPLSRGAKARAKRVLRRLAEAEAKVHGIKVREVHLHELGAADTIVDICLSCEAFEMVAGRGARVLASPINLGSGFVRMRHGLYPVPAPAVAEILKGAPVYSKGPGRELCTPTGAALLLEFVQGFGLLPPMVVEAVGYGAGEADFEDFPNVLRVFVGSEWG
ncbi:MAG TPA: LarC family nickel insertion protein, partial [Armatimonadetes bacterium]|nr:LarC family nickel insertion protein [Armatimonadota bacterium]